MNGTPHTYTYDANGNMTSGPDLTDPAQVRTRTITYNGDNMPAEITVDGNTVDFVYDGSGVRAKKTVNQTNPTYYIGKYYEKRNGLVTKYIFAGNTRIAKIKGTDVYYFHKDHLASSTLLTNASGTVVETTEYMPFGGDKTRSGALEANYKYTDQEYDLETGLYNYRARLYDPVIETFITPDSIVPHPSDPQMLNRYAYCRNNPIKYVDPTGHMMDLGGAWGALDLGGFGGSRIPSTIGMYVAQSSSLGKEYAASGVTGNPLHSYEKAFGWDPNARPDITVGTVEYRVHYDSFGGGHVLYAEGGVAQLYNDQTQTAFELGIKSGGIGLYTGGGGGRQWGTGRGPADGEDWQGTSFTVHFDLIGLGSQGSGSLDGTSRMSTAGVNPGRGAGGIVFTIDDVDYLGPIGYQPPPGNDLTVSQTDDSSGLQFQADSHSHVFTTTTHGTGVFDADGDMGFTSGTNPGPYTGGGTGEFNFDSDFDPLGGTQPECAN